MRAPLRDFVVIERMFYSGRVRVDYRIEPCKTALTQVRGMPFRWSLNPYMGCSHKCTFCYVHKELLSSTN